ncbi:hypothetical protein MHK_000719 [Candidatus Magnetomorum sp. HK-1]|nr:hypothetical protein MHK_000719 [Candidatus Magnetomorum sp. HK-1]
MENSGAKAALRGYRLQTLYILSEILKSQDTDFVFQPEGQEDLAIYDKNELVHIIQVKARSEALSLSSFFPEKENSYFHRLIRALENHPNSKAKIISFGEIGPEIQKAWNGDITSQRNIKNKLAKNRITNAKSELLFKKLCWECISEESILEMIDSALRNTVTSGNSEHALSLLTAWLYSASENKSKVTYKELVKKITSIGEYFAQREAHHHEWYISIKPLCDNTAIDVDFLSKEFYQGVSTRFKHIQANLDVKRNKLLEKLNELVQDNRTVIIHGASGQGKSTLAFRYLHDYVPEQWRFVVQNIDNKKHAQSIALAITDHLSAFQLPVYLYIEVSSRDSEWPQLVKSLLDCRNVKLIISIREEDLARQQVPDDELGLPSLLPLHFTKKDAIQIYEALNPMGIKKQFPSPEHAWLAFGGKGSLLEFIYFLTQTESLETRLKFQVKRLRRDVQKGILEPAILKLLFSCSVATAFESRVKVGPLTKSLGMKDPASSLSFLENEYLIRFSEDQQYIEALHPIRSKILSEIIIDPAFHPLSDALELVIDSVYESDLYSFLLHLLASYPKEVDLAFNALADRPPQTWRGYSGVCRALLWRGIARHVHNNIDTIQKAREVIGDKGWQIQLLPDVAGALNEDPSEKLISILEENNPQGAKDVRSLKAKMTPRGDVFHYLLQWLKKTRMHANHPANESDWSGLGEVLTWISFLNVDVSLDISWLSEIDIEQEFSTIEPLASMLNGLYSFDIKTYEQFTLKYKHIIVRLFQLSTDTLKIEYRPDNPISHYIIPFSYLKKHKHCNLNELSVYRARLLKKLFPYHKKYGAKGYGHQNLFFELPIDESNKPGILTEALPIDHFVRVNAIWSNYADYTVRPNDWNTYIEEIIAIREKLINGLLLLNNALNVYFKKKQLRTILGKKIDESYWRELARLYMKLPMLPKVAVDPWGITSESTLRDSGNNESSKFTINLLSIQSQYKAHIMTLNNYTSSLTNFYSQSYNIILVNCLLGRNPPGKHGDIFQNLKKMDVNYTEHLVHLSVYNLREAQKQMIDMQIEFRNQFASLIDIELLSKLEKKEHKKIEKIWPLWFQFAHYPQSVWKNNPERKALSLVNIEKSKLIKKIEQELICMNSEGLKAEILNTNCKYEEKKSLWISIEGSDLFAIDDFLAKTVTSLTHAIRPLEVESLKYFILTGEWENIVIVPTVKGSTLSNFCWVIFSGNFTGDKPVLDEEKIWQNIPRFLDKPQINNLGLCINQPLYSKQLSQLEIELGSLSEIISHMTNFSVMSEDLNETGKDVLTTYLSKLLLELKDHIKKIKHICETYESDNEELKHLVEECKLAALSYDISDDITVNLHLSDYHDWFNILHSTIINFQIYKWTIMKTFTKDTNIKNLY